MLVLNDSVEPALRGKRAVGIVDFKRIAIRFELVVSLYELFCRAPLQKRDGTAVKRLPGHVVFRVEQLLILRIRQIELKINQLVFHHHRRYAIFLVNGEAGGDIDFLPRFRRNISIKHRLFWNDVFRIAVGLCAIHELYAAERCILRFPEIIYGILIE